MESDSGGCGFVTVLLIAGVILVIVSLIALGLAAVQPVVEPVVVCLYEMTDAQRALTFLVAGLVLVVIGVLLGGLSDKGT